MSEETKKMIEELKAIRLELFRSAASLDTAITQAELFVEEPKEPEDIRFAVKCILDFRRSQRKVYEWDNLDKKEYETWDKLINSIKEEDES